MEDILNSKVGGDDSAASESKVGSVSMDPAAHKPPGGMAETDSKVCVREQPTIYLM
jgi:hypothetical protein